MATATQGPIDRLVTSWWFGDGLLFVVCAGVIALSALMAPSTEALTLFGVEIPVVCTFRRVTGYGCPGCGLTRSFAFMAHLAPLEAFRMNPMGPFLFLAAATQVPWRAWKLGLAVRARAGQAEVG